jgi:hypothetical protein
MTSVRARHSAEDLQWMRSDAWVLAAIRLSGSRERPGALFDLVAACDAVNHLIASRPEIEHAMSLLIGAGLVMDDVPGFAVTEQGRAVVTAAGKAALGRGRGGSAGEARIDELLKVLLELPAEPVFWELDPRDYEAACLEYRHTMWTEYRKTSRNR